MMDSTISIEGFRPSSQQEHLWLLHREGLAPAALCAIRIGGDLDPQVLQASLHAVVDRHEILRTHFHRPAGVAIPLQVITPASVVPFSRHDLRSLSPGEQDAHVDEIWRGLHAEPLDVEQPLLLTTVLLQLAADEHLLLVRLPALCTDRASFHLLCAEVGRTYEAELGGETIVEDAMQYVDFCEWQQEILESPDIAAGRAFWSHQTLANSMDVRLPAAGEDGEPGIESVPIELDPHWSAEIGRLIDAEAFLLACWQTLLARLTGQSDVLVGVLTDGRKFAELRGALGAFAERLPVRCRVQGKTTLRELRRLVGSTRQEAYEWQEAFTWQALRGTSGSSEPEFPFGFEFCERPASCAAAGLSFTVERWSVPSGRPEVELSCLRGQSSLALEIRYDAGRLARAEAASVAARLRALIGAGLASPEAYVDDLESLSTAERDFLLRDINATASPFPDECIHELLANQAARTPDACAVIAGQEHLTYRELHERANRVAGFLQGRGVGPDVRVAICLGRSPEMLVAMLGILKAGGAYVPIDPSYPAERLALLIEESDGPVVLTLERFRGTLAGYGRPLLCLDSDWPEISREAVALPALRALPEHLAYVIYTSGSTGRPKGVLISHRNLVHSTRARLEYYQRRVESFLLLSSFAFDSSVAGIYGTLAQGGALVLPEEDSTRDVPRLLDLLDRHSVSHLLSLPSLYANLLNAAAPGRLAALGEVIVAGEACSPALIARHQTRLPGVPLYDEYGPTEGTVWSTVYEIPAGGDEALIGRPITNMRVYVLNAQLRPVMLGSPGELFIAGEGVARGYHDRPDLTAGRFIPNPFAGPGESGGRLYRTGDLARVRPDGCLEFLGRVDHQVKIRGYRIELEEVEAALGRHPDILELAVVAREEAGSPARQPRWGADEPGDLRLVAYVVAKRGNALQGSELRAFVAASLPDYMVPSIFVPLAALPLTPNGKVNRQALPAPEKARTELLGAYVAPGTLTEEVMASIWASVLRVEQVGARDNFFDLGGHSLLAIQLVSRLRETFRVDITAMWLFAAPTVQDLATRIDAARREGAGIDDLPLAQVDRGGALPLSFGQQRLWFIDQFEPASPVYNVGKSFRISGRLNPVALERSLGEVVRRHEVLRTTFRAMEGSPAQVILPHSAQPLPVIDLRHLPEEERREIAGRLAAEELATPFDLANGPLVRSRILLLDAHEHGVLFTMHHVVSDEWSMNLLVREVSVLYEAFLAGRPSPLRELEIQYADFAGWQQQRLRGEALNVELSYWRAKLAGAPNAIDLPTDCPRPAVLTSRGEEVPFALAATLSDAVKALARSEGVTLFMVLLGAFQVLLGRYARQEDVCVGTPIAGRTRRELEELIGFFVNTIVLRIHVRRSQTFRQLLAQIRDVALEAYAHQDLPFEKLVEDLAPQRSLNQTPLFQAIFALQQPTEALPVAGLRLSPLVAERNTAKYDLTLLMSDGREGLRGVLGYRTDLFHAATAARMTRHLETLLEAAVADPDLPLSDLPLMREAERSEIVEEWNETASAIPAATIPQLFEEQARRTPDAVAVTFAGESLSYRELDRRASRVANYLRTLGVGSESQVGLMMDRSPDLITAMVGILKTGGAYLPLDPTYPEKRLASMVAGVELALTQDETQTPALSGTRIVYLDRPEVKECIAAQSDVAPAATGDPDSLAYVMYTSGSTGQPKGVAVVHRNVVRLVRNANYARMGTDEIFLQLAPVSFDASTLEIWAPLLNGGRLVLYPEARTSLDDLGRTLREEGVSTLWLTAGLFHQMVEERLDDLATVRQLLAGGDVLSSRHVRRVVDAFGGLTLINGYGPTENTTFTCCYPVTDGPQLDATVPIGRPITNTTVYLLDEELRPVPARLTGELYAGGAGVARGYLSQPALTAERFVPSPFGEPGSRLYRTSDLARYRPDGAIEFLGRADRQVKIRGFRVEPGDIEAALRECPGVTDAAVVAVAGHGGVGDKRLVAFVAISGIQLVPNTPAELKAQLSQCLPEFMVPSSIVVLEHIPLGPTGKVDRRRLLEVYEERQAAMTPQQAEPRTATEAGIAAIWCQLLGLPSVGVDDDFFELGGHSLLATQVLSRLRQAFTKEIPLRLLFEARTVAELAESVEASEPRAVPDLPPVVPVEAHVRGLDQLLNELELS